MRSKASGRKLAPGEVVRYTAASSGGYGDPRARAPHRVLADWLDGYIDLETARDAHGVVIRPEDGSIDEAGTARLRAAVRRSPRGAGIPAVERGLPRDVSGGAGVSPGWTDADAFGPVRAGTPVLSAGTASHARRAALASMTIVSNKNTIAIGLSIRTPKSDL